MQSFANWQRLCHLGRHAINCLGNENGRFAVRCMKLIIFILIVGSMHVYADGYSQRITLSVKDAKLKEVFKVVSDMSGYQFIYNEEQLERARGVTLSVKDATVKEVMDECLKGQAFSYTIRYGVIIVKASVAMVTIQKEVLQGDTIDVKGKVVNEKGEPVEGVSVRIKGQGVGTSTQANGEFMLRNVPENGVLIFSAVNIEDVEWKVSGNSEMMVNVKTKVREEQEVEVVSTGYQVIPKERATGSFVKIDNGLFNRRVGATVVERLGDVTNGLLQVSPIGAHENPLDDIAIRGFSTINANKRPLLVVDNFIYDGDINTINPNDIESVTILKDAAAASIWGVRAGNGVIVLTTKKGHLKQKTKISINSNIIIGQKPDLFKISSIPSKDILALEKRRFSDSLYNDFDDYYPGLNVFPSLSPVIELLLAARKGEISQTEAESKITQLENHDIRNDIEKYFLQTRISQQYALNISGGGDNYYYYGSVGYDVNRPNEINNMNNRLTIRFNNVWKPTKNLELSGEIVYGNTKFKSKNLTGGYYALLDNPYKMLVGEDGNAIAVPYSYRLPYLDTVSHPGLLDWQYRPLDETKNGNSLRTANDIRILTGLSYIIIPGLTAELSYQWQKIISDNKSILSEDAFFTRNLINSYLTLSPATGLPNYPIPLGGVYEHSTVQQESWNMRTSLRFNKKWGNHEVSAISGVELREVTSEQVSLPTQYGYNPQTYTFGIVQYGDWALRPGGMTQTLSPTTALISGFVNRFGSFYGNGSYTLNDKYIVSISGRVDQSNFFGVKTNDRKIPLWSIGFAWVPSKEKFYNINWLSSLKLRGTYGYNGNTNPGTSPFATAIYLEPQSPLFTTIVRLQSSPNPSLKWERVRNLNLGIDFATRGQRITGSIDFYQKTGLDLIGEIKNAPSSGFATYTGNYASMKNSGIDISIQSLNINRAIKWSTILIANYYKDKVTSYSTTPTTANLLLSPSTVVIGKPLNHIFSYRWGGLNPSTGDAQLFVKKEVVGSANYLNATPEDMVFNGSTVPSVFGAFRNDLQWENLSISVNLSYRLGYYFRRTSFSGTLTDENTWGHSDYLLAWKKPGDENHTNVPGFMDAYPDNRYAVYNNSNILISKGDHIRLQDIRVSYDIRNITTKYRPFRSILIYGYLNNLGIILWKADKAVRDPDIGGLTVPSPRTLSLGVNITI